MGGSGGLGLHKGNEIRLYSNRHIGSYKGKQTALIKQLGHSLLDPFFLVCPAFGNINLCQKINS